MSRKALFLDRDGVININYGYVHKVCDFEFLPGIFDLTRTAFQKDYIICVVTNQAGIGRGLYSEQDFSALTDWMCDKFRKEGVIISGVYYSPYHPIHGIGKYKRNHNSRKPNPGMLIKAISELNIDPDQSILIGDNLSDIQAAIAAGISQRLLLAESKTDKDVDDTNFSKISSLKEAKTFLKDN